MSTRQTEDKDGIASFITVPSKVFWMILTFVFGSFSMGKVTYDAIRPTNATASEARSESGKQQEFRNVSGYDNREIRSMLEAIRAEGSNSFMRLDEKVQAVTELQRDMKSTMNNMDARIDTLFLKK